MLSSKLAYTTAKAVFVKIIYEIINEKSSEGHIYTCGTEKSCSL